MSKFMVIKQVECSVCHGVGKFEHPDGDIERCTFCRGIGHWESEVGIKEAAEDAGYVLATPASAQAVNDAAGALSNMHFVLDTGGPVEHVSATALVAIAEQLAALNTHMAELADSISDYVASRI